MIKSKFNFSLNINYIDRFNELTSKIASKESYFYDMKDVVENRKIIHIDMDAFYASVEQRNNPELRGKPVAVGGSEERGVIAAASYEARKFGVKSAMTGKRAKQLCPSIVFVKPNFEVYKKVSIEIKQIFSRYTAIIEPLSLDEAFLDVTFSSETSATYIANAIKNDIKNELSLIASAGVSYNKFLSKIASDMDKPDGLFVITPEQGADFIKALPVKKFFGVGKVTAEKMKELGIIYGKDLLRFSLQELITYFGKSGTFFYSIARGIDLRPVKANKERKSIGAERTFTENSTNVEFLKIELEKVVEILWKRYKASDKEGKTVSLKIKFSDFTQITRAKTLENTLNEKSRLFSILSKLLEENYTKELPVRLIGASLSGFIQKSESSFKGSDKPNQLTLL